MLANELDHEVGYDKHSNSIKANNNRRNGSFKKTIIDGEDHKITIDGPRDRAGEFTTQLVPKGIRRFSNFDDKVISLYARDMTIS
jgi:putative transposase